MTHVLGEAGRAFLKAFLSALVIAAAGFSAQANLNQTIAVGVAALMAAIAAGLAAVQVFVPAISFRAYVGGFAGALLDSFAHAFLGAFLVSLVGWMAQADYSTWHSFLIGAFVGALNVGLRALQGALTHGEPPAPRKGVRAAHAGPQRVSYAA